MKPIQADGVKHKRRRRTQLWWFHKIQPGAPWAAPPPTQAMVSDAMRQAVPDAWFQKGTVELIQQYVQRFWQDVKLVAMQLMQRADTYSKRKPIPLKIGRLHCPLTGVANDKILPVFAISEPNIAWLPGAPVTVTPKLLATALAVMNGQPLSLSSRRMLEQMV